MELHRQARSLENFHVRFRPSEAFLRKFAGAAFRQASEKDVPGENRQQKRAEDGDGGKESLGRPPRRKRRNLQIVGMLHDYFCALDLRQKVVGLPGVGFDDEDAADRDLASAAKFRGEGVCASGIDFHGEAL